MQRHRNSFEPYCKKPFVLYKYYTDHLIDETPIFYVNLLGINTQAQ